MSTTENSAALGVRSRRESYTETQETKAFSKTSESFGWGR
jgi:hypothetical protein